MECSNLKCIGNKKGLCEASADQYKDLICKEGLGSE